MVKRIVVLGVSGSGKSEVGRKLAEALGSPFFDGDDFHSDANVKKMSGGIPLTDDDREDWLITLNSLLQDNQSAVIACSGLKPKYRDILRHDTDDLAMVYLKGDIETIWQRHQKRDGHYFNGRGMLENQFANLIEPKDEEAIIIDIDQSIDAVVNETLTRLQSSVIL